jgi:pimeloyl-ACP methyl ester carboxylesterase
MRQLIFSFLLVFGFHVQAQEGNFIETNGVKLYYEIHGEGEALLLLHGNTQTHGMWTPWLDDLSTTYKVITVDLRGHGKSTNPTNNFSHKEHALDIYGLLEELNIEKFRAMGFSTGGMTLIHMATMQTDRIQSLILIGAAPYFTKDSRNNMSKLTYEHVSVNNPGWMEYMKNVHPGGEKQIRNLLNVYVEGVDIYDDMNFTPPYLSTINCPTLIIHGDQDPFFPLEIPMVLHEAIPNSHLWIIPKFAHSTPQYGTELGNLFLSTITEFMTGNWDK